MPKISPLEFSPNGLFDESDEQEHWYNGKTRGCTVFLLKLCLPFLKIHNKQMLSFFDPLDSQKALTGSVLLWLKHFIYLLGVIAMIVFVIKSYIKDICFNLLFQFFKEMSQDIDPIFKNSHLKSCFCWCRYNSFGTPMNTKFAQH